MTNLLVVPARWGSSRFPGKPLAPIGGRTLLERVVDLGRRAIRDSPGTHLLVATDHPAIAEHAASLDCPAVITDPAITSGSGRALAAARQLAERPRHVINLQGDAPFVPAEAVAGVIAALATGADCATPVVQLDWPALDHLRDQKRTTPFSGTTCVRAPDGRALWFSKAVLPAIRDEARARAGSPLSPVFRHLGLYGYTFDALKRFETAPPSAYEQWEGLEQLRLLEQGIAIQTVVIPPPRIAMSGIDTPEDVCRAEALLAAHGDPFGQ